MARRSTSEVDGCVAGADVGSWGGMLGCVLGEEEHIE